MFQKVELAIQALKNGKMILLSDDSNRENEADLIFPAQTITPEIINFMIRQGTGIVCLSILPSHAQKFNLPLMVSEAQNSTSHSTPFCIPIDAKQGISTGVSSYDRAKTIQVMMDEQASEHDLVRPGHIFPLQAKIGGVLERPGHTEGAIDIVKLAGFKPAAVLCELMNPDGTMTAGKDLHDLAAKYDLPILSIAELIQYRLAHENQIKESTNTTINLADYGQFLLTAYSEKYFSYEHLSLFKPSVDKNKPLLVRVHSSCTTGDIFNSEHCDCHDQLHYSLKRIKEEGGLLIYLDQEGRGVGLINKIKAYAFQEKGYDTVEANLELGLAVDGRKYYMAAHILKEQGIDNIRLLTNNPAKIAGLQSNASLSIIREAVPSFNKQHNQKYLHTKKQKLAHLLEL